MFKGRQKKSVEYLAIKRIDKSQMEVVVNEVQLMHALSSPHTLRFYDWYETRNNVWVIIEYCTGGDLRSMLKQDGRLPETAITLFGLDLMAGLHYLHTNGVLYCDLKPSNVLVDEYGIVKLSDFGLARRIPTAGSSDKLRKLGRGTPYYMAPELFMEDGIHSFASDLWALGCTMFELAHGWPPFTSQSLNELIHGILYAEPPLNGDADAEPKLRDVFLTLLRQLLAKDPLDRPTWDVLLEHPVWASSPPTPGSRPLPAQPLFETTMASWRRRKSGVSSAGSSTSAAAAAATANDPPLASPPARPSGATTHAGGAAKRQVDILQLSRVVQHNLTLQASATHEDAAAGGAAQPALARGVDVQLLDADTEVDFSRPATSALEGSTAESLASSNASDRAAIAADEIDDDSPAHDDALDDGEQPPCNVGMLPHGCANGSAAAVRQSYSHSGGGAATGCGGAGNAGDVVVVPSGRSETTDGVTWWVADIAVVPPVGELVFVAADAQVRPIVANKVIEEVKYPHCSIGTLTFAALSADELNRAPQPELEAHLRLVYQSLASGADVNAKMNVLAYLHPLAHVARVANIVINSSFLSLLLRMIRRFKSSTLRTVIVTLLGLLVRHATIIVPDEAGAKDGIVVTLSDLTQEASAPLRRRAVAALGELLFYIATQDQDEEAAAAAAAAEGEAEPSAAPSWLVPSIGVAAIVASLSDSESDDIVEHYAAKTVENTLAQANCMRPDFGFGSDDVQDRLIALFAHAPEFSPIRATASTALALLVGQTLRAAEQARESGVDPVGVSSTAGVSAVVALCARCGADVLAVNIADGEPRLQQAFLNIVNVVLVCTGNSSAGAAARTSITAHSQMVPALVQAAEHSASDAVRAKALLCACLIGRIEPGLLASALDRRLLVPLSRLTNHADTLRGRAYLYHCILMLLSDLCDLVGRMTTKFAVQLAAAPAGDEINGGTPRALDETARCAPLLVHGATSPLLREHAITPGMLMDLSQCLAALADDHGPAHTSAAGAKAKRAVLLAAESVVQHSDVLLLPHLHVTTMHLLPSVCVLLRNSAHDLRMWSISMLRQLLPSVLDNNTPKAQRRSSTDALISEQLLPLCEGLLSDREPIPYYALLLLTELEAKWPCFQTEIPPALVRALEQGFAIDDGEMARELLSRIAQRR